MINPEDDDPNIYLIHTIIWVHKQKFEEAKIEYAKALNKKFSPSQINKDLLNKCREYFKDMKKQTAEKEKEMWTGKLFQNH